MHNATIFAGNTPLQHASKSVEGEFVTRQGAAQSASAYYRISHYDQMSPFFMSIVSPSNHWMFISSNGALTAGRKNPQHALFPYYTDDKIHDSPELTGSKTILLVKKGGRVSLWEPFSNRYEGAYALERNLYKSIYGNSLIFEEKNIDLGISFSYEWCNSNQFGFVKHAHIQNTSNGKVEVEILDGIQNMLPFGVTLSMQTELSTLIDAYKKNEIESDTGLGIFRLSSILVDRPEPSEALKATTVWSAGIDAKTHLLSSVQLDAFRKGLPIHQETDIRAERGAYFVHAILELESGAEKDWHFVAETTQGPSQIVSISQQLKNPKKLIKTLQEDIRKGTESLIQIVAEADGLQLTRDNLSSGRHFSNVLFNVMRGGIFDHHYQISKEDFVKFFTQHNAPLAAQCDTFFQTLPETFTVTTLLDFATSQDKALVTRLCYEYLPLTFSRRHGDPSRPWNFFSIEIEEEDGSKAFNFQGNWRDIFQNWEALSYAYPGFTESIIHKFVNASTPDGYNPYRITREGIDWEEIDADDPWSFIGYWGDHQIIYLLKLLEASHAHHPGLLSTFLAQPIFVYANVPYRIKPFEALIKNPHDTIIFDDELNEKIKERVAQTGADGKLVWGQDGEVFRVTFTEKILVTVLAKMSNFIPEAGIWLNTQRPEWNDANNALVGYGVSMVTLCYLRRFLVFFQELLDQENTPHSSISVELTEMLGKVSETLQEHQHLLDNSISNVDRKNIQQGLGKAGSAYRSTIYKNGFSGSMATVLNTDIHAFLDLSLAYIDHTIQSNKREDNLYHAYNLISLNDSSEIGIRYLYEMLEGQVAVLSSGFLSAKESIEVLAALKASALYREDQYSFMLYPNRKLPRFTQKNIIPSEAVETSPLFTQLLAAGNHQLIEKDIEGGYHFNGNFRNVESVKTALQELAGSGYEEQVASDTEHVLAVFEKMFDHQSFTGRSGTFFGYEGLGSIYWHMVSKLLLAVCETYSRAFEEGESDEVKGKLAEFYYEIRAGIGLNKSPELYGAFPTDPYSHTPGNAGVQQPGMTGQVKEDILSRWGELGVVVQKGAIHFLPILLRKEEFMTQSQGFTYFDLEGKEVSVSIPKGSLAFTYCQTLIVFTLSDEKRMVVTYQDERTESLQGTSLPSKISANIFNRDATIKSVEVFLNPSL